LESTKTHLLPFAYLTPSSRAKKKEKLGAKSTIKSFVKLILIIRYFNFRKLFTPHCQSTAIVKLKRHTLQRAKLKQNANVCLRASREKLLFYSSKDIKHNVRFGEKENKKYENFFPRVFFMLSFRTLSSRIHQMKAFLFLKTHIT
jgi:hypothetical protein